VFLGGQTAGLQRTGVTQFFAIGLPTHGRGNPTIMNHVCFDFF
jgi:hypothetical protein